MCQSIELVILIIGHNTILSIIFLQQNLDGKLLIIFVVKMLYICNNTL